MRGRGSWGLHNARAMKFGRSLFGYSRQAVDQYVAEQEATQGRHVEQEALHNQYVAEQTALRRTLEAEIASLRAAEPMLKVNQEVSSLLTSFASTVTTMREQAEREATHTRVEADGYAQQRRDEADRLFSQHSDRASAVAGEIVQAARDEVATLAHNQAAVWQSLRQLAEGVAAWLATLERLRTIAPLPPDLDVRPTNDDPEASLWGPAPALPSRREDELRGPQPPEPVKLDPEHGRIVDFRPRSEPGDHEDG
jgi:hypothetical protein